MKTGKSILLFVLTVSLLLFACACSSGAGKKASADEEAVKSAVEEMYKINYGKVVEEVKFNDVKIYTAEEIAADPALQDYDLGEKDIVFEIQYELKIIDGYEDMMQFTAATGDVKGSWVVDKYNVGIARYVSDGEYTVDSFGTAF